MKQFRILICIAGCVLLLAACKKDYEAVPLEKVTIEYVFDKDDSLGTYAEKFLNTVYSDLPSGYNRVGGDILDAASDDAISGLVGTANVSQLATGAYSSFAPIADETPWTSCYAGIRTASIFVSNIDVSPVKDKLPNGTSVRYAWKGEARFLRALFYFELLKRYGGIPLMGDTARQLGDDVQIPRSSFADCVQYLVHECDAIKDSLRPNPVQVPEVNSHRATRGAALALKARILLYAASPLFNGQNIDPKNPLTGYTDYDKERWKLAADAARDMINEHTFSLLPNTKDIFITQNNSEVIFFRQGSNTTTIETTNGPVGFAQVAHGRTNPTQELVDAFPMANGLPITDPNSGYRSDDPYTNRDPRLASSILYNGAQWLNTQLQTFDGGANKPGGTEPGSKTSYYMRKFMGNFENATQYSNTSHDWIILRYTEVLLNFAEAENEYNGPTEEVYQVLKDLRQRAGIAAGDDGMYGLTASASQDVMRQIIHNERRLELAFEEHRFWDIRRWKIAEQVYKNPLHGMQIINDGGSLSYNIIPVFTPAFSSPKMYLYPIPYDEVVKNDNMRQNPGW
ncbi:Starch-binding associating with outer membrane [Chitinophaga costaii]|uniref:Starch-binding associating with outer membrane n=1 Tax=Chitinophaga costaii TaxID=1335309 RepID=A0A1C4AW27_9BACT|nr:RagB/SusD family nutrient uptake outer membrane protein [Chitinophaga costaii]PUZ26768.1 RagB/SusD family nutrient uptake outer membrane protein [Chitinophaga costaii]SCB98813.1 Starch-binding associating with outer membrane [Chitinophaga costaii]